MRHIATVIYLLVLLSGCSSSRQASTSVFSRDSISHYQSKADSLYRVIMQRDSTYHHDSIHVFVKGDTVEKYVEKTIYRFRTHRDTVYHYVFLHDTAYVSREDSVVVEKVVYKEKPLKSSEQAFLWIGRMCCLAFLIIIAIGYIFRNPILKITKMLLCKP